jgi:gas vesicle protein
MSEKKQKSALDKIIMGAIIGTAVGSALGLSLAPKKGKETREILVEKSKEAGDYAKETGFGFLRLGKVLAKRFLFGKKPVKPNTKTMRELPDEMEIFPPKAQ